MKRYLQKLLRKYPVILDYMAFTVAVLSGRLLKYSRAFGFDKLPLTDRYLERIGLLPINRHYYEPLVHPDDLRKPLSDERAIAGLDLNTSGQIDLLNEFNFQGEIRGFPLRSDDDLTFDIQNDYFGPLDAKYLYSMIRHFRPSRMIEIGSGQSTLVARIAIAANTEKVPGYECDHLCIEPFENPWLEMCGARIVRKRVENCDLTDFQALAKNDILFIDSSHVIRPQGDVLFEFFEIFGALQGGALIHIHDIFTPRDYPEKWVLKQQRLWNEQYLLEAFLSYNRKFEVLAAVNYLWKNYPEEIERKCPTLANEPYRNAGSFWFRKL